MHPAMLYGLSLVGMTCVGGVCFYVAWRVLGNGWIGLLVALPTVVVFFYRWFWTRFVAYADAWHDEQN